MCRETGVELQSVKCSNEFIITMKLIKHLILSVCQMYNIYLSVPSVTWLIFHCPCCCPCCMLYMFCPWLAGIAPCCCMPMQPPLGIATPDIMAPPPIMVVGGMGPPIPGAKPCGVNCIWGWPMYIPAGKKNDNGEDKCLSCIFSGGVHHS